LKVNGSKQVCPPPPVKHQLIQLAEGRDALGFLFTALRNDSAATRNGLKQLVIDRPVINKNSQTRQREKQREE
jgi:hypothetical protein